MTVGFVTGELSLKVGEVTLDLGEVRVPLTAKYSRGLHGETGIAISLNADLEKVRDSVAELFKQVGTL